MKKIILSLVAVLSTLSINAETDNTKVLGNVIEVYNNNTLVETYRDYFDDHFRAELKKGASYENQLLIYKNSETTPVATYTNDDSNNYRADLKQVVIAVQLWAGGPKWAMVNVGATITDYTGITTYDKENVGNYYSWGAMEDQTAANYAVNSYSTTDIQGTNHDTAKMNWGKNWKMHSKSQFDDLIDPQKTKWEWCDGSTTQFEEGCTLAGYKITGVTEGYTENSMFLPAAGSADQGTIYAAGGYLDYWCSQAVKSGGTWGGYCIYGTESGIEMDPDYATTGGSVRAIYDETGSDPVMWVKDITVSGESNLTVGTSVTFTATVVPTDAANKNIKWSSEAENIATVDQNGVVTPIKAGSTTILATAQDGSGVSGAQTIVVTE